MTEKTTYTTETAPTADAAATTDTTAGGIRDVDAATITPRQRARLLMRHQLHEKYAAAVELYATGDTSVKAIAERCGVSRRALSAYLRRYWRELVLRRHGIDCEGCDPATVKMIAAGEESQRAHEKYKHAVAACADMEYIDLNLSQVARKFGLEATALGNFMRVHHGDVLACREELRRALGIAGSQRHGALKACVKQYAGAVRLYASTEMTQSEIAARCGVSESGLSQHLRFYHRDVLARKRDLRRKAQAKEKRHQGDLNGNGSRHRPSTATVRKYARALALYRDTAMTMKAIVEQTGVPKEGFRHYLNTWHRPLVVERSGLDGTTDTDVDLRHGRRRMKTVTAKYAPAIESLRREPKPVAQVAREFGLHPDVFRQYLRKYEPSLLRHPGEGGKEERTGKE